MKLGFTLFAVAALTLVATAALATVPADFPPPGSEEATVWQYDPDTDSWGVAAHENCEAFRFGAEDNVFCNGDFVDADGKVNSGPLTLDVEASVAQYIEATLGRSNLTFYVLKPYEIAVVNNEVVQRDKEYAADCIDLGIKSNGNVTVASGPIGQLENTEVPPDVIPVRFAVSTADIPYPKNDPEWKGLGEELTHEMLEDQEHEVNHLKLWCEIHTSKCNSACDYSGKLNLYFILEEQKPWVITKLVLPQGEREDP